MCYSPFRHFTGALADAFSFDLHALATPPAFVLSQDQTLKFEILASAKHERTCFHPRFVLLLGLMTLPKQRLTLSLSHVNCRIAKELYAHWTLSST